MKIYELYILFFEWLEFYVSKNNIYYPVLKDICVHTKTQNKTTNIDSNIKVIDLFFRKQLKGILNDFF
jgi:hypothetical protein